MAKCCHCNRTITFGGKTDGKLRFCNDECHSNAMLVLIARQLPEEQLAEAVRATHAGNCPKCRGRGPVDVHTSYRVWSFVVLTGAYSRPQVSCLSCRRKAKLGDSVFCLLFGWWGIPFGLVFAPYGAIRNLIAWAASHDATRSSDQLHNLVSTHVAASVLNQRELSPRFIAPQRLTPRSLE
jgi:hypothetical protein